MLHLSREGCRKSIMLKVKSLDRVPRKVLEWAMRMTGIPEFGVMVVMREQRQVSEWILSCQRSEKNGRRLKWGCIKDLFCHLLFLQWS